MTLRELLLNADLEKGVNLQHPDDSIGRAAKELTVHAADDCFTRILSGQHLGTYALTIQDVLRTDWELSKSTVRNVPKVEIKGPDDAGAR